MALRPFIPGDRVICLDNRENENFVVGKIYNVYELNAEFAQLINDAKKGTPASRAVINWGKDRYDAVVANHTNVYPFFKLVVKESRSPKWL